MILISYYLLNKLIMKFCEKCKFMLYIKLSDDNNSLSYECKNCGYKKDHQKEDIDNCIYSRDYKINEISYSWMVNPDLCDDPTLPRVNNISCPNDKVDDTSGDALCPTKNKTDPTPNEVIYVLFDKKNLKYFYMCCHCHTTWKHE